MNFSKSPILKKLGLLAIMMVCLTSLKATHIVGGEMTYTCMGNDVYEVQLTIYRDCFYANPLAFFDDPAYIGVFDKNNTLVGNLQLPLLNNDTIPPVLNDPCLFVPADVCVHTTTYRGLITLPFIEGGYQLAYERCCRNETILNIIDPLNAGAVYNTYITERTMQECNNAAKFTQWPPLFVCVNEPIDWDHSALDVDGDSLVYSLCTPLSGGSQAVPQPIPTNNPPYDQVVWNDPAFDLGNLLGGAPLQIDSQTGRLTAIPGVMGQFVVGICVSEYRDGEKISETRRDFQYNVGECGMVESTIVAPAVQCEDFSVSFTNDSQNADGYQWNFNDPNNPGASSTLAEPTYTYSEPGTYTIELIASTRGTCTDTSYHTIFLQRNSMNADFVVDVQDCVSSSTLVVSDQSTDPISNPSQWSWSLSENGTITQSSSLQNPTFIVSTPVAIELTLTSTSVNGCVDASARTFNTQINDPGAQIATDIEVCKGAQTAINPGANDAFSYQWQANEYFDDLSAINPSVSLDADAQLSVVITSTDGTCASSKTINVTARDLPVVDDIIDQLDICSGAAVTLNTTNYPNLDFQWTGANIDDANSDTPTATPTSNVTYNVLVTEVGGIGCSVAKEVNVTVNENPDAALALVGNQAGICNGTSVSLNTNGDANFDYTWNGVGLSGVTTLNPTVGPSASTDYEVTVTNRITGCTSDKTVAVIVADAINLAAEGDRSICFDTETTLQATGTGTLSYQWMNSDGSIMSSDAMLVFDQQQSENIELTATNEAGCKESIFVQVDVAERVVALDNIPDSVLVCENIPTSLSSNVNNQFEFLWSPTVNIDDASSSVPVFTADETTVYTVLATDPTNGCQAQKSLRAVVPQKIDLRVSDDVNSCGDAAVMLSAESSNGESYSWIQSNGASVGAQASVQVDPRVSANYLVEVVDEYGCFITDSVRVNFVGVEANIADDNLTTCDDELQLLLTDVNANANNSYTWGPSEAILSGENSANPIVLNNTDAPITFSVVVSNDQGCIVEDQVTVTNRFALNDLDTGVSACLDIDLELNPNFNSAYDYSWGPANLLVDPTAANPSYEPTMDQVFTVTVTDADGCSTIREVSVSTMDLDEFVEIEIESDTILSGEETQLEVTFDPDFSYQWIPPTTLSNSNVSNPIANPTETTNYSVMVTNSQGCVAIETITLNVLSSECDEPFVFFPNAFTPNGDGLNDVLRVRGNALSEVRFIIYDRWGEAIFETNSVDGAWDGTYKGKQLAPDVYGYYLEAKCIFGGEYKKQGNVTILD